MSTHVGRAAEAQRAALAARRQIAALAARRQIARAAFWDHLAPPPVAINGRGGVAESLDEAIESAVRVRVTSDVIRAATTVSSIVLTKEALEAAFAAAGFKVEE